eukprot:3167822-Amphidinium_carterae.1
MITSLVLEENLPVLEQEQGYRTAKVCHVTGNQNMNQRVVGHTVSRGPTCGQPQAVREERMKSYITA